MTYATVSDIQAYFQNITFADSPATSPTLTRVTTLLADSEALVVAMLTPCVQMPITGTNNLALMKQIIAKYTAGEIDRMFRESFNNPQGYEKLNYKRDLKKDALDLIDMIKENKISIGTRPQSISYCVTDSDGEVIEPVFTKTMQF